MIMLRRRYQFEVLEAGVDEAGRGCLAGPVYAAAVILPEDFICNELNDSNQLSKKLRDKLRPVIEQQSISWAIGIADQYEIDSLNILNASHLAMHRAIEGLKVRPGFLIIDGNRFKPYAGIESRCIVKGDATFMSIAAASILAKTHRDEFMNTVSIEYPCYIWGNNKGYPTEEHRKAIINHGLSPLHRRSFSFQQKLF